MDAESRKEMKIEEYSRETKGQRREGEKEEWESLSPKLYRNSR